MTETGNGATPPGLALLDQLEGSKLVPNIMHFGRVLRSTGMPVGPGKILDAVQAVQAVGIASRRDFYWSLHAVFVNRRDQHEIFDQAFHIFWRDPHLLERMLGLLMPQMPGEEELPPEEPPNRRVMEALNPENKDGKDPEEEKEPEIDVEATMTASSNELLQKMDFEDMSAEEISQAKAAIARMRSYRFMKFQPDVFGAVSVRCVSTCGRPYAPPCVPADRSSPAVPETPRGARLPWLSCAIFRAPWAVIRACCCISCMPSPMTGTVFPHSCLEPG